MLRESVIVLVPAVIAGCTAIPKVVPAPGPAQARVLATPNAYRAPDSLSSRNLAKVIGADRRELERLFGPPRLVILEGAAIKLQFAGKLCVVDVYLYPPARGREPRAVHIDARRPRDGAAVDEASCVRATERN